MIAEGNHPAMLKGIGDYHLIAVAKDGAALYESRNWRMGGRTWRVRLADGTERNATSGRPKPPGGGRWQIYREEL